MKICIITAARSEYGLLRWIIDEFYHDETFELQLIVTGSHLSEFFGNTVLEIEADGYPIAMKVDINLEVNNTTQIAKTMGTCANGMANAFEKMQPDMILILGDRYELLPICNTALLMNIPIGHISGGDITEGAIDNQIRNAISMMSKLHFPGVEDSAKNLRRMLGVKEIFVVGEPGLENFLRLNLMSRQAIARSLNIDIDKKWVLITQHSETTIGIDENLFIAKNIIEALQPLMDFEFIITKSNADFGGNQINAYFEKVCSNDSRFKLYASLGQLRYLSFMKEAYFLIGNSSSGIVEAPYLAIPVINIGERQTGRFMANNIVCASGFGTSIYKAIEVVQDQGWRDKLKPNFYYGDGKTAKKIKELIKEYFRKCKK